MSAAWKYEFKINYSCGVAHEKWAKIFLSIGDVESFDCGDLLSRIREKCNVKEINSLKYLDSDQDWIDLHPDDFESFLDMIETAQVDTTRENIKKVTLKIHGNEAGTKRVANFSPSPVAAVSGTVRANNSPSTSKPQRKKSKSVAQRLFPNADPRDKFPEVNTSKTKYVSPTQKFFDKLEKEIQERGHALRKKRDELLHIEQSFSQNDDVQTRPLCSNCHSPGHNKSNCNFAQCPSATICKQIKRHCDEEKYVKGIRAEIKEKTRQLDEKNAELKSKRELYNSMQGTFSARVQADLINSKPEKYLRRTMDGGQAPIWLLVNSDIRKLEKVCKGKVPPKENIQDLLATFDERCSAPNGRQANDRHTNPAVKLWQMKGIRFPGSQTLPNDASQSIDNLEFEEPESIEEEDLFLRQALDESLVLCNRSSESSTSAVRSDVNEDDVPEEVVENQADYGLNLLSRAANILDDLLD